MSKETEKKDREVMLGIQRSGICACTLATHLYPLAGSKSMSTTGDYPVLDELWKYFLLGLEEKQNTRPLRHTKARTVSLKLADHVTTRKQHLRSTRGATAPRHHALNHNSPGSTENISAQFMDCKPKKAIRLSAKAHPQHPIRLPIQWVPASVICPLNATTMPTVKV
jgi:hypothetical protein